MNAEDLRSYVAQRHFTASQLVPRAPALTWEAAFAQHHNNLLLAHDAMRDALRAVRQGDDVRAEGLLAAEVRSSSEEEEEEEKEETDEEEEEEGEEQMGEREVVSPAA